MEGPEWSDVWEIANHGYIFCHILVAVVVVDHVISISVVVVGLVS